MPKSKVRKKPNATATRSGVSRTPVTVADHRGPSAAWYPIVMAAVLLIGLAYIVVYYIAPDAIPGVRDLGGWNLAIGFGVMVLGLFMSVRWR